MTDYMLVTFVDNNDNISDMCSNLSALGKTILPRVLLKNIFITVIVNDLSPEDLVFLSISSIVLIHPTPDSIREYFSNNLEEITTNTAHSAYYTSMNSVMPIQLIHQ
jgi:hypothetical protein